MKKFNYTLIFGIFAILIVLYLITAKSIQGFQDIPSSNMPSSNMPSSNMPSSLNMYNGSVPISPTNDSQNITTPNLMQPTTTPAAMNTATTTIKLSDLQKAKDAINTLKAAVDNLH